MGTFIFTDNSDEFEKALDEQLEAGFEAVGLAAEGFAKKNCPVDCGRLRNSISHDVGSENGEKAAYIGTNISYAPYVEMGTSKMKPQPYVRPAVQDHITQYENTLKKYLKG